METFDITIKAILRDDGKLIFQALAEKERKTGQHLIWKDGEYIEDVIRDLGREIRKVVSKDTSLAESVVNSPLADSKDSVKLQPEDTNDSIKKELNKDYDKRGVSKEWKWDI